MPERFAVQLVDRGDAAVVKYREYLKSWEDNGWRIDWSTVRQNEEEIAYAIPSPGRRESRNWVIDEIPMMPGK